jgi:protein-disulfide isomerase
LTAKYIDTGQLTAHFKHLPLPMHADAATAAAVAECAGDRGQFWQVHDRFFEDTRGVPSLLSTVSAELSQTASGGAELEACVARGAAKVGADVALAKQLGVDSTPSFFFGRLADGVVKPLEAFSGARPMIAFDEAIEKHLRR